MTGTAALPSAFISVEKRTAEDGSIVFRVYGGGFGHGVGMSQNGAHSMAKAGKTYKDILDFSIMERRSGQNKTDVSGWQPEAETWSGKTEYGHKKTRFRKRKYFLTVFLVVMYLEAAAGDSFCQYLVSHCQRQLADWLYILFNHMVRLIRKPLHSVFRGFLILRVYHKKYQCDGLLHRHLCPRQCKPPR